MIIKMPDVNFLCSGMFSDSLDKLGYRNQIISGLLRNQSITRFMGRARTVLIETIETNDENIATGLGFLDTLNEGDVLVISGSDKFAYFGEMMTRLCIRQGVSGVIIDGLTRDTIYTHNNCSLPIIAKGYTPIDIKGRGRVKSVDVNIEVSGVKVSPNNLIFADNDAVCIIPTQVESELIESIKQEIHEEQKIINLIDSGTDISEILRQVKSF